MADTTSELMKAIEEYADTKLWVWTRENPNIDERRRLDEAREKLAKAIAAVAAGRPSP